LHSVSSVFVNLGLGENVTNFNYTLTQNFWNETGNGTLCVPNLPLPVGLTVTDGTKASLQVVTLGDKGNALYNVSSNTPKRCVSKKRAGILISGVGCSAPTSPSGRRRRR